MRAWYAVFFVSASCATTQPVLTHRVCTQPLKVAVARDVDYRVEAATQRAAAYWVSEIGANLIWVTDEPAGVVVEWGHPAMDAPKPMGYPELARALFSVNRGCLVAARIIVAPDLRLYTHDEIESVMRHELGHLIGLEHTYGAIDVMGHFDADATWPPHPVGVWGPQLDLLRAVYR